MIQPLDHSEFGEIIEGLVRRGRMGVPF